MSVGIEPDLSKTKRYSVATDIIETHNLKVVVKASSADFVYQKMPLHDSNDDLLTVDDRFRITLANRLFLKCFVEYCITQLCVENILFYIDTEIFQTCTDPIQKATYAYYIYQVYVAQGAPMRINLTEEIRNSIIIPSLKEIQKDYDEFVYDEAQQYIYANLKSHTFINFTRSNEYAKFVSHNREGKFI